MANDPFDLERFVTAQNPVFETALSELRAGRKRSHWIWYIFPQLRGLGRSATAKFYGIGSLEEARAYLLHPLLDARLIQASETALTSPADSLHALFGSPDDLKFRSSMTLFALASAEAENVFEQALARWCGGRKDEHTLALLSAAGKSGS